MVTTGTKVVPIDREKAESGEREEKKKLFKRPAEKSPVSYIDWREIQEAISLGRIECDAATLGAGFMGGGSRYAILAWCVMAIVSLGLCFHDLYEISPHALILKALLVYLAMTSSARAVLLYREQFRAAFMMFVFLSGGTSVLLIGFCGAWIWAENESIIVNAHKASVGVLALMLTGMARDVWLLRFARSSDWLVAVLLTAGTVMAGHLVHTFFGKTGTREEYIYVDPITAILLWSFGTYCFFNVRRQRIKADQVVADDRAEYDRVWSDALKQCGQNHKDPDAVLDDLSALVAKVRVQSKPDDPLRRYTEETRKRILTASKCVGAPRPQHTVSDLAVLLSQACALNEHFADAVRGWAAKVDGTVVHASPVKRRSRAIEKLHRCYRGNAALITDLVRASVSCRSVPDLAAVLRVIYDDPRVAILTCKNRFDKKYDSRLSAGYRNLALLLVLVDADTLAAGAAEHIIELQIDLASLHDLKNDGGHNRYVAWRNMRAA